MGGSDPLLGNLLALAGAVAVAGYLVLGQDARRRTAVSTYGLWVYGSSALALLGAALLAELPVVGFDAATWWAIAGLIAGPQLLGHTVFNQVLGAVSATTVATVVLVEPILATLLALLLLGEVPSALVLAGAPLVLAGVYLVTTGRARGGSADEPELTITAPPG